MVEERITRVETPSGDAHTHTTVVSDSPRSGGAATWVIVLLLVILAAVAVFYLSGMSGSEAAKVGRARGSVKDVPGRGWSSPIIWDDQVFVTAAISISVAIAVHVTSPATTSGVSAANVVATMEVPSHHQGRLRPAMK